MSSFEEIFLKIFVIRAWNIITQIQPTVVASQFLVEMQCYFIQKLKLIIDVDILTLVDNGIRGGLSQCRLILAEANNRFIKKFDVNKSAMYFMLYFDINSTYAWTMMSQFLQNGGLKILAHYIVMQMMKVSSDNFSRQIWNILVGINHGQTIYLWLIQQLQRPYIT